MTSAAPKLRCAARAGRGGQDAGTAAKYYRRLAEHFELARQYESAERYYIRAGYPAGAVEMYARADKWDAVNKARAPTETGGISTCSSL